MSYALLSMPVATRHSPSAVNLAGSTFAVEFKMEEILQLLKRKDNLSAYIQSCSGCGGGCSSGIGAHLE